MAMCSKENLKARCLPSKEESAHGSHIFRAYDSADGVMDLPADAPGRAHRRGCAELLLRHTALLRAMCCWRTRLTKNRADLGLNHPLGARTCESPAMAPGPPLPVPFTAKC